MLREYLKDGEETTNEKVCGHRPCRYDIIKQKIHCPFIRLDAGHQELNRLRVPARSCLLHGRNIERAIGLPVPVWGDHGAGRF